MRNLVVLLFVALALLGLRTIQQDRRIRMLEQETKTRLTVVTPSDLERLKTDIIERQNKMFSETVRLLKAPQPVVVREVRVAAPTPESAKGPEVASSTKTGPLPKIAAPMIRAEEVAQARKEATERIVVGIAPGHLVDCPTPGLEGDNIELIRDQEGRLLSPTTCVASIRDEVRLATNSPQPALSYNLGAYIKVSSAIRAPVVGLEYNNKAWGGYYRIQVGHSLWSNQWLVEFQWTIPLP